MSVCPVSHSQFYYISFISSYQSIKEKKKMKMKNKKYEKIINLFFGINKLLNFYIQSVSQSELCSVCLAL